MKKSIYFISIFSLMIMLYVSDQENKKLENMTTQYTDNYVSIIWEDRTYIPFCAIDNSEKGIQIGIVNGDKNYRVYEYRAYSTDEWIISFYRSGEMDNSMLMKEINVTEIPDNLQYDYK